MKLAIGVRNSLIFLLTVTFILGGSGVIFINYSMGIFKDASEQEYLTRLFSSHINYALSDFRKSRLLASSFMINTRHLHDFYDARVKYLPEFTDTIDNTLNELSSAKELSEQINKQYKSFQFIFDKLDFYQVSFNEIVILTDKSTHLNERVRENYKELKRVLVTIEVKYKLHDLSVARLKARLNWLKQDNDVHTDSDTVTGLGYLSLIDQLTKKIQSLNLPNQDEALALIRQYRASIQNWHNADRARVASIDRFVDMATSIDTTLEKLDYDTKTLANERSDQLPSTTQWIPAGVIGTMLSIVLLVSIIAWVMVIRFNQGVNRLFSGISLISQGKLDQPIKPSSVSELDALAKIINDIQWLKRS